MDVTAALVDIDTVMKKPSTISAEPLAGIAAAARYYQCLCRYCPPGTPYRKQADRYEAQTADPKTWVTDSPDKPLYALLAALKEDIYHGKLATFEELVHADVYADLLAQADDLLQHKAPRAAAVIAGAALEEHVKKLAIKHGTGVARPDGSPKKASQMNTELRAANVYPEVQRTAVEGYQKLRNGAAHAEPGFEGTDVSLVSLVGPMIAGVRAFIAQYPA